MWSGNRIFASDDIRLFNNEELDDIPVDAAVKAVRRAIEEVVDARNFDILFEDAGRDIFAPISLRARQYRIPFRPAMKARLVKERLREEFSDKQRDEMDAEDWNEQWDYAAAAVVNEALYDGLAERCWESALEQARRLADDRDSEAQERRQRDAQWY